MRKIKFVTTVPLLAVLLFGLNPLVVNKHTTNNCNYDNYADNY